LGEGGLHAGDSSLATGHLEREEPRVTGATLREEDRDELFEGQGVVRGRMGTHTVERRSHVGGEHHPFSRVQLVGKHVVEEDADTDHPRHGLADRLDDLIGVDIGSVRRRLPERDGELVSHVHAHHGRRMEAQERLLLSVDQAAPMDHGAVPGDVPAVRGGPELNGVSIHLAARPGRPLSRCR
jgi:hypothetical protein